MRSAFMVRLLTEPLCCPDEAGGVEGGGELVADGLELGGIAVELGVHFRVAEALGVIPEALGCVPRCLFLIHRNYIISLSA